MAQKIVLDAGHGGADPGAVFQGRQEKDDNLALTLDVGKYLEDQGADVIYTRTTDIYQTPFEKAQIANRADADYFVSFHRNSSAQPNQYNGVQSLVYDKSGIKLDMAENINGALGEIGFEDLGVDERPGLVVLRRTKMPAVMVEAGFINSDIDNQLFDNNREAMAKGIGDAILGTINEVTAETEEPLYYRVQTGTYRNRKNAEMQLYQLQSQGYPAFLLFQDGFYRVQVGAFQNLGNAIVMERRLRRNGYPTLIVT